MTPDLLLRAVEALIFAADAPLGAGEIARLLSDTTGTEVKRPDVESAVERLNTDYEATGRALRIHRWGGYRMATTEEVAPFVRAMFAVEAERRMTRPLLETLAIVAYRQPVSKPEIDFVRGVNSDYTLRTLLERDLVTVVGRSEGVGRPLLYGTTEQFLDQFGLGTLEELPRPREIEELLADPAFSRERALLMTELVEHAAGSDGGAVAPESVAVEPAPERESAVEPGLNIEIERFKEGDAHHG